MKVSRTISLDLESLTLIQEKMKDGEFKTLSDFVQIAVANELKEREHAQFK